MNKFIKIMLIVSSIIAIIGIVLIGIGTVTGAKLGVGVRSTGIEIGTNEKTKDSILELEEFSIINTDLGYSDVVILEGSDFGIEMTYYNSNYVPEYKVENGILYITDNSNKEGKYNFINLDLSLEFEKNEITIYIPVGYKLEGADITLDSGEIKIDNITVKNLKTSNGLGNTQINLLGNTEDYSFDLDTLVGTVNVNDKIKGIDYKKIIENSLYTVDVKNSMGNIKVTINN